MNLTVSPTAFVCPACNAQIDQPCTQATNTGRRNVTWYHIARLDLAADASLATAIENRNSK